MLKGEMKAKKKKKKKTNFLSGCWNVREKKGEEVSFQNLSLRFMEIDWSEFVGPKTKVHLLDKGYAWVAKT